MPTGPSCFLSVPTTTALPNGPFVNAHLYTSRYYYAHESAHSFGARDEYKEVNPRTDQRSGYLNTPNENAYYLDNGITPNPNHTPSLMATAFNYDLSQGAIDAIGWRDSDNDTIPDILDPIPLISNIELSPVSPTSNLDYQFAADLMVNPYPSDVMRDITITGATYQLDSGPVIELTPNDLVWGGYEEQVVINLPHLTMGEHNLSVQVFNSVDNTALSRRTSM